MKNIRFLAAAALTAIAVAAFATTNASAQTVQTAQPVQVRQSVIRSDRIDPFSTISLSGNLNVELLPSDRDSISITLIDSDIAKFKWNVSQDGELSASLRSSSGGAGRGDIKIYSAHPITAISVSGSSLIINDTLRANSLVLNVSGKGKLTAAVDLLDLDLTVAGNSAVSLTGSAKYLTLKASETSKVNCRYLQSVSVQVDAATNAEVFVWGSERAVMSAGSGATIFYRGKPVVVKTSIPKISLGASINNIGE